MMNSPFAAAVLADPFFWIALISLAFHGFRLFRVITATRTGFASARDSDAERGARYAGLRPADGPCARGEVVPMRPRSDRGMHRRSY